MNAKITYQIQIVLETENYKIAAKRFENTFCTMGIQDFCSSLPKST